MLCWLCILYVFLWCLKNAHGLLALWFTWTFYPTIHPYPPPVTTVSMPVTYKKTKRRKLFFRFFVAENNINMALVKASENDPAFCPNGCGRSYRGINRKKSLKSHMVYYCGVIPRFKCEFCLRGFKSKQAFMYHLASIHGKLCGTLWTRWNFLGGTHRVFVRNKYYWCVLIKSCNKVKFIMW